MDNELLILQAGILAARALLLASEQDRDDAGRFSGPGGGGNTPSGRSADKLSKRAAESGADTDHDRAAKAHKRAAKTAKTSVQKDHHDHMTREHDEQARRIRSSGADQKVREAGGNLIQKSADMLKERGKGPNKHDDFWKRDTSKKDEGAYRKSEMDDFVRKMGGDDMKLPSEKK